MHGERNYPAAKMRSDLDVALQDVADDREYLGALERHLPAVLDAADADIAFYLAGVDVAAGDRYGKLALSEEGIRLRDRLVINSVRGAARRSSSYWAEDTRPPVSETAENCTRTRFEKQSRTSAGRGPHRGLALASSGGPLRRLP